MRLISPHLTFPVIFWQLHSSFSRDLAHGIEPDGIPEMGSQRSFFLKSSPPPACSWPIWRNWWKGRTPRYVILQVHSTDKILHNVLFVHYDSPVVKSWNKKNTFSFFKIIFEVIFLMFFNCPGPHIWTTYLPVGVFNIKAKTIFW